MMSGLSTAEMVSVAKLVAVFFCCITFTGVHGQACTEEVKMWVSVPEANYDRNYSSIDDQSARPLGFERTYIPYSDLGLPNPCIAVTGIDDTRVEIMAESNPPGSKFCVKDQYNREICDARIYDCRQANNQEGGDNTITFEFYCDSTSCDESDVGIFYRFTVSQPGDTLDPELFCDTRSTDEYPSSLNAPLPTNRDLVTVPPDRTNGAPPSARQSTPLLLALCSAFLCLAFSSL